MGTARLVQNFNQKIHRHGQSKTLKNQIEPRFVDKNKTLDVKRDRTVIVIFPHRVLVVSEEKNAHLLSCKFTRERSEREGEEEQVCALHLIKSTYADCKSTYVYIVWCMFCETTCIINTAGELWSCYKGAYYRTNKVTSLINQKKERRR